MVNRITRLTLSGLFRQFLPITLLVGLLLVCSEHASNAEPVNDEVNSSAHDRFFLTEADNEFGKYQGRAEFTYLTNPALDELRQKPITFPNNSIVVPSSFYCEVDITPEVTLARVAQRSEITAGAEARDRGSTYLLCCVLLI